MRHINLTILITILVTNFALTSCNKANISDNKNNLLNAKENELLKTENQLLKKEKELKQKITKTKNNSTIKQQTVNSTSNNLDFLKEVNGKYPYEVKLLENPALIKRLKNLIGNSRYNFLKETWDVEAPMEYTNNVFVAIACQAHYCSGTNFIIVVDFSKNVMYVCIREEEEIKIYSEDGSNSEKVTEWIKNTN